MSYDSAPRYLLPPLLSARCLSFSVFMCVAAVEITEGGGGGEWPGAKLYDRHESLALCKSFNTLCVSLGLS